MREQERLEIMLQDITRDYRYCAADTGLKSPSTAVVDALRKVPRHRFVPSSLSDKAYVNSALPIGEGQTISQPFIVALMTDLLQLRSSSRVLDVGTGCGYQAAVLSQLVADVYSIEILPELHESAKRRLGAMGYSNVHFALGNGCEGWPCHAPYDGILVAAATESLPKALLDQLAPGGRMVLPLVASPGHEVLTVVEKAVDGQLSMRGLLPVRFVPLVDYPVGAHRSPV